MQALRSLVSAVLGVVLAACSSESATKDFMRDRDAYLEAWAEGACRRSIDCWYFDFLASSALPEPSESEAACVEELRGDIGREVEQLAASIDEGRVVYHPDELAECLSAIAAPVCELTYRRPEVCHAAFEGRVPSGGACLDDYDCGAGNRCTGLGCARTCQPYKTRGQDCTVSGECASGLRCVLDLQAGPPSGSCEPPGAPGDTCSPLSCDDGLWCAPATDQRLECAPTEPLGGAGAMCGPNAYCDAPLACRRGEDGLEVCVEPTEGVACESPRECGTELRCLCADVACSARHCGPPGHEGEPCQAGTAFNTDCAPSLYCGEDGTCRRLADLADPCESDFECLTSVCANGICQRRDHCAQ